MEHKLMEHKMLWNTKCYGTQNVCFEFLYSFWSETFLILRRNERDVIESVHWSSCEVYIGHHVQCTLVIMYSVHWSSCTVYIGHHVQYRCYSYQILMKLEFFPQIFEIIQISNFMKIRPMEAELFHGDGRAGGRAGGRTDMTYLVVAFRNFANSPKNQSVNAVQGNNRYFFSDPHKTHKSTVWGRT